MWENSAFVLWSAYYKYKYVSDSLGSPSMIWQDLCILEALIRVSMIIYIGCHISENFFIIPLFSCRWLRAICQGRPSVANCCVSKTPPLPLSITRKRPKRKILCVSDFYARYDADVCERDRGERERDDRGRVGSGINVTSTNANCCVSPPPHYAKTSEKQNTLCFGLLRAILCGRPWTGRG